MQARRSLPYGQRPTDLHVRIVFLLARPGSGNGCLGNSVGNRRNHMLMPWIISRRQKVYIPAIAVEAMERTKGPTPKKRGLT
jgi:hypothetical protein